MNQDNIPQDVVRCDLCKMAIVHSYCDFCHVNLCKPCIGEHVSEDYKTKHIVVPFQQRRSTLIYPKCETHPEKSCKYQCKTCNVFLCSHCIVSKQHKEHDFLKLEEVFNTKKEHIQKDTEELTKHILPKYDKIVNDLGNEISSLDGGYTKLKTEMSKERENIHRDVDKAFDQIEKEIGEMKINHHTILKKHLNEVKHTQSLIQQTINALYEMEESNEVSSTIRYSSKNQMFIKLPPRVSVALPKFISKQAWRKNLRSFVGDITPLSTTHGEKTERMAEPTLFELIIGCSIWIFIIILFWYSCKFLMFNVVFEV